MKKITVLLGSPHKNGVTDRLAESLAQGLGKVQARIVPLRDFTYAPCDNCGFCLEPPHACIKKDAAIDILTLLRETRALIIFSPIYFYNVPAHFKALIDRSQYLWNKGDVSARNPAIVILTAAREKGEMLFSGALLTLKYFLANLDKAIAKKILYRGMENRESVTDDMLHEMRLLGRELANPGEM